MERILNYSTWWLRFTGFQRFYNCHTLQLQFVLRSFLKFLKQFLKNNHDDAQKNHNFEKASQNVKRKQSSRTVFSFYFNKLHDSFLIFFSKLFFLSYLFSERTESLCIICETLNSISHFIIYRNISFSIAAAINFQADRIFKEKYCCSHTNSLTPFDVARLVNLPFNNTNDTQGQDEVKVKNTRLLKQNKSQVLPGTKLPVTSATFPIFFFQWIVFLWNWGQKCQQFSSFTKNCNRPELQRRKWRKWSNKIR